jgi:8-oxo-dGTP diphosphatase
MPGYGGVSAAALAILRGPRGTITFVAQRRGPYQGHWLLPGGRIEVGEFSEETARREVREEVGCRLGRLSLTGVYEMHGHWSDGTYHVIMFAYLAHDPVNMPANGTGDSGIASVVQRDPAAVRPHPTVMRVLNDAGLANFAEEDITRMLAADQINICGSPAAGPPGPGRYRRLAS